MATAGAELPADEIATARTLPTHSPKGAQIVPDKHRTATRTGIFIGGGLGAAAGCFVAILPGCTQGLLAIFGYSAFGVAVGGAVGFIIEKAPK